MEIGCDQTNRPHYYKTTYPAFSTALYVSVVVVDVVVVDVVVVVVVRE